MRQIMNENALLWTFLWQSAAFVTTGLMAAFALRRRPARAHHVLLLAIVAAVVVPLATTLARRFGLGVFAAEAIATSPSAEPAAGNPPAAPRFDLTASSALPREVIPEDPIGLSSLADVERVGAGPIRPQSKEYSAPYATPLRSGQLPWPTILLSTWAVVSAMLVLRLALKFAVGARLARSSAPAHWQGVREAARLAADGTQSRPDRSLHWAAHNGHVDLANRLISSGADVEAKNRYGRTPLALAAHAGHKKMVELLLATGADIDARDIWYYTPLFHAARNGHADMVVLLLARGADAEPESNLGYTPLSLAAENGHAPTVKVLLDAGVNVNTVGNGRTPLGRTVSAGHLETVRLLVAAGADVNTPSSNRETPLVKAASGGHIEITRLLIAAGAKADHQALEKAGVAGNREIADLLLEEGAAVSFPALHFTAFMGDLPRVAKLIEQGADVDSKDDDKQTPLLLAALGGMVRG